jgi:hypothetical protein
MTIHLILRLVVGSGFLNTYRTGMEALTSISSSTGRRILRALEAVRVYRTFGSLARVVT